MRRALRLAQRGLGSTRPNPPVGAVIVSGDEVVGEGWHRRAGGPHAEIEALTAAGDRARGATVYLTLEPCTRHGRTPPCAPRLIEAGIARAVIAAKDPSPEERGAGVAALTAAGIEVEFGVCQDDAAALIGGFERWVATRRPRVTLKAALSLDGKVAAADGSSRWVSGPASRRDAHRLRGASDAVMAGIGTVLADDPRLTCRLRGYTGAQPTRVVLDSTCRTPLDAAVLDGTAPAVIFTTSKPTTEAEHALRERGAEVVRVGTRDGRVDVGNVLDVLGERGMLEVLVEGGPTVAGELVDRGLVDRFVFYLAPKLLGHASLDALAGLVVPNIADARELTITSVRRLGEDVRIEGKPRT